MTFGYWAIEVSRALRFMFAKESMFFFFFFNYALNIFSIVFYEFCDANEKTKTYKSNSDRNLWIK